MNTGMISIVLLLAVLCYRGPEGVRNLSYQIRQAWVSVQELWSIPEADYVDFLDSFRVFNRDTLGFYENATDDFTMVRKYYKVLNRLCTLGNVEKMYIPPIMDPKLGVFENQMSFEAGFADELNLGPGKRALEIGCGRGRITHHVASRTGANCTASNIDPMQIEIAKRYATETGLGETMHFLEGNMNDPFPFEDSTFDAFYQVQAMTYAQDLKKVFSEIYRVVKPGAKISVLDGVMLDGYNNSDASHRKLLREAREVTGWGHLTHHSEWKAAAEAAGFITLKSEDASWSPNREGSQAMLIEQEGRYFGALAMLIKFAAWLGIVPKHIDVLLERMNKHLDSYLEMDKNNMLTTSWHIIAQKPA